MACPRATMSLWYVCVLPRVYKKNHNKKNKILNQLNIKKLRLLQFTVFSRKKIQN